MTPFSGDKQKKRARAYRRGSAARIFSRPLLCLAILAFAFVLVSHSASAQAPATSTEETVVNLAAGRVVILVAKDAIIVGTVENPIEAETTPPIPVELGTVRLGIILGAANWMSPSTHQDIARLNQELPRLRVSLLAPDPHLQNSAAAGEATDIEGVGQGVLERLNQLAQNLHAKVDLPPSEPLAQLILVDYLSGYGPEVWQLSYAMKQEEQAKDYWVMRVLRPSYVQSYPPEKGQPRTLIEFAYPLEAPPTPLLELVRQKDPRLEKVIAADPKLTDVASRILQGQSPKILGVDAIQFLRAALDAIAPPNARETMAVIREEEGFQWILPPPAEPKAPKASGPQPDRPPDAPSLLGAPH
jgi:hypothetical protein